MATSTPFPTKRKRKSNENYIELLQRSIPSLRSVDDTTNLLNKYQGLDIDSFHSELPFQKISQSAQKTINNTFVLSRAKKEKEIIDESLESKTTATDKGEEIEKKFKALYFNNITDAFTEELDAMRSGNNSNKSSNETQGRELSAIENKDSFHIVQDSNDNEEEVKIDVNLLVEILSSGMDIYTDEEKALFCNK